MPRLNQRRYEDSAVEIASRKDAPTFFRRAVQFWGRLTEMENGRIVPSQRGLQNARHNCFEMLPSLPYGKRK